MRYTSGRLNSRPEPADALGGRGVTEGPDNHDALPPAAMFALALLIWLAISALFWLVLWLTYACR